MKLSRSSLVLGGLFVGVALAFLGSYHATFAADAVQYTQLENIPGYEGKEKTFPEYVVAIYNLALWLVGISAMFMLTVGGFMYLTSAGNTSSAGTAKGLIKDALIGLVLGLSAWLIVNTINPDLTTMNISGLTSGTATPTPAAGDAPAINGTTGNCGGMKTSMSGQQCDLVSSSLNGVMQCMSGKGTTGPVTSISANNVGNNLAKAKACCGDASCTHATESCHYGCNTSNPGYSHAMDYATAAGASDAELCAIADVAWECGAGANIWGKKDITCSKGKIRYQQGHGTHLHIADASCNH